MSEIEWLLNKLWLKPHTASINASNLNEFEEIREKRMNMKLVKFPFKIPETIIYKGGEVQSWYFRAKDGLMLK
jgi:hypothetical protein